MASIFTRFMDFVRGKRTLAPHDPDDKLDPKRAEQGLNLSGLDGDPRTTQAMMDDLGMRSRIDDPGHRDRKAA